MPHLALNIALLLYLLGGALVFGELEQERDLELLGMKARRILEAYKNISIGVEELCVDIDRYEPKWKEILYESLGKLSEMYEPKPFRINPNSIPPPQELMRTRWTFIDSVLYALSILTTTGNHILHAHSSQS